ncbi:hypothetical protein Trydic_g19800 [Trypoxylus dichotomus]
MCINQVLLSDGVRLCTCANIAEHSSRFIPPDFDPDHRGDSCRGEKDLIYTHYKSRLPAVAVAEKRHYVPPDSSPAYPSHSIPFIPAIKLPLSDTKHHYAALKV